MARKERILPDEITASPSFVEALISSQTVRAPFRNAFSSPWLRTPILERLTPRGGPR